MTVAVSACLLGQCCKYNGGSNRNDRVLRFTEGLQVIPVCPEVLGGLPVPRVPAEIRDGRVTAQDGTDVDDAFRRGAEAALRILQERGAELVILQPRSPSCGYREIYDGTFQHRRIPGRGVFAQMAAEAGIPAAEPEDLPD